MPTAPGDTFAMVGGVDTEASFSTIAARPSVKISPITMIGTRVNGAEDRSTDSQPLVRHPVNVAR